MPHPSSNSKLLWKSYWEGLYATPRAWAHKGENLIHAFEAVAASSVSDSFHLDMTDQALMLAGMSVEVQLKAILVSDPALRKLVTRSNKSCSEARVFYSHNLVELAHQAHTLLSVEQTRTATALTQYILWRGRYVVPVEKGIVDFMSVKLDNGLHSQSHRISIEAARDLICRVVSEVKLRLYSEAPT